MTQTILTPDMITRTTLASFTNELVITRNTNRQFDDWYGSRGGAKIGDTLRVRLPQRFTVSHGPALQTQEIQQQSVPLVVTNQEHVDMTFTSAELTLDVDKFRELFLDPAAATLANYVDADVASAYKFIGNSVGTPGTTPSSSLVLNQAMQKLTELGVPRNMRYCAVNPAANTGLVEGSKGLFNSADIVSRQMKTGLFAQSILGYEEISQTANIATHTTGSRTATGGTTSAAVTVEGSTSIAITGAGANATVRAGDVFTVAGCYAVNPLTRSSTGSLFQFVALNDVTLSAGGAGTITVYPIYSSANVLATVDALPTNGANIVFMGAPSTQYPQNLVFHKHAIAFVTVDMADNSEFGVQCSRQVYDGIGMRYTAFYDGFNDRAPRRLDVMYGFKVTMPSYAVRIWG